MRVHLWIASFCSLIGGGCTDHARELQRFAGEDLGNLADADKVQLTALLAECLSQNAAGGRPTAEARPLFLAPYSCRNRAGFILFEARDPAQMPGASFATVHFLTADGEELASSDFATGWLIGIVGASFKIDPTLAMPLIEIRTAPLDNGAEIHRQVFGVFDDRVALLRVEDLGGKLVVNNYYFTCHTLGPAAPALRPEEWERVLVEGPPAQALEALVWIGGRHRKATEPAVAHASLEADDSVDRVAETRQRPEVRRAIDRLTGSYHRWVREAAVAALQEMDQASH